MFWSLQHLRNLPELADWTDGRAHATGEPGVYCSDDQFDRRQFLGGGGCAADRLSARIAAGCVLYFLSIAAAYGVPLGHASLVWSFVPIGICQGLFALFTMYLPPLFPTLLRTTGAGFCYNIGRMAAGCATVYFGRFSVVGDYRLAILWSSLLFLPAAVLAMQLSEPPEESGIVFNVGWAERSEPHQEFARNGALVALGPPYISREPVAARVRGGYTAKGHSPSRNRNMLVRKLLPIVGFLVFFAAAVLNAAEPDTAWKLGAPIVTYWAGPALTDAVATQMAEGGWNLVWCTEKELDVAKRHGLRAQLYDRAAVAGHVEIPIAACETRRLDRSCSQPPRALQLFYYR